MVSSAWTKCSKCRHFTGASGKGLQFAFNTCLRINLCLTHQFRLLHSLLFVCSPMFKQTSSSSSLLSRSSFSLIVCYLTKQKWPPAKRPHKIIKICRSTDSDPAAAGYGITVGISQCWHTLSLIPHLWTFVMVKYCLLGLCVRACVRKDCVCSRWRSPIYVCKMGCMIQTAGNPPSLFVCVCVDDSTLTVPVRCLLPGKPALSFITRVLRR